MGSILKDLKIQQYIISHNDIGRKELDEELERLLQAQTAANSSFKCNPNNSAAAFDSGIETLSMNQWTRLGSTPLPQYFGLSALLADFTSVSWLHSCFYQNFFQNQTSSLENQLSANFSVYVDSTRVAVIISKNSSMYISNVFSCHY